MCSWYFFRSLCLFSSVPRGKLKLSLLQKYLEISPFSSLCMYSCFKIYLTTIFYVWLSLTYFRIHSIKQNMHFEAGLMNLRLTLKSPSSHRWPWTLILWPLPLQSARIPGTVSSFSSYKCFWSLIECSRPQRIKLWVVNLFGVAWLKVGIMKHLAKIKRFWMHIDQHLI